MWRVYGRYNQEIQTNQVWFRKFTTEILCLKRPGRYLLLHDFNGFCIWITSIYSKLHFARCESLQLWRNKYFVIGIFLKTWHIDIVATTPVPSTNCSRRLVTLFTKEYTVPFKSRNICMEVFIFSPKNYSNGCLYLSL